MGRQVFEYLRVYINQGGEYAVGSETTKDGGVITEMANINALGAEGWELVAVTTTGMPTRFQHGIAWFKRAALAQAGEGGEGHG